MASISIRTNTRSLVLTKSFATKAAIFGTDEYKMLQEARRDYPGYKVTVAKPRQDAKKKDDKDAFKGLTYDYMEKYIATHDDDDGTCMTEFLNLRGKSDDAVEALADSASYREIRDWFLMTFPAIKDFYAKRAALLARVSA